MLSLSPCHFSYAKTGPRSLFLDCRWSSNRCLRKRNILEGRFGCDVRNTLVKNLLTATFCVFLGKYVFFTINFLLWNFGKESHVIPRGLMREVISSNVWPCTRSFLLPTSVILIHSTIGILQNSNNTSKYSILPTFPFFLFFPGTFPVIYSLRLRWGWPCFSSGIEIVNWTRPGGLAYPISSAMVTFQSRAHNPSQTSLLTCWDRVRVPRKNSLMRVWRGWYMIWGQLAAILPAASKAPSPEIVRATRPGCASWAQLAGYKAQKRKK